MALRTPFRMGSTNIYWDTLKTLPVYAPHVAGVSQAPLDEFWGGSGM